MNLTELRIGNFITENGGIRQVVTVSKDYVYVKVPNPQRLGCIDEWKNYARNIEPVPITVEWLDKLGFRIVRERYKTAGFIDKYDMEFDLTHNSFTHALDEDTVDPIYYEVIPRIHYVHQLQNLFFALTGEELEMNRQSRKQ